MKKIILLVLVVMVSCLLATSIYFKPNDVYAVQQFTSDQRVYTYASTGGNQIITTITTDNNIVGYTYTDSGAGRMTLYDGDAWSDTSPANKIIAIDGVIAGGSVTNYFPYPRDISEGVISTMNTGTGKVTIYYE